MPSTTPTIHWVQETASTNAYVNAHLDTLDHGHAVAAHTQTAGRGQRGNSWEAKPGQNLTFSLLLKPAQIQAAAQFQLSMIVALSVCNTLQKEADLQFEVKWPNDIYHADKKICGILIENSLQGRNIAHSIVGIGVNINQLSFESDAPNPVSLAMLTGRQHKLNETLHCICAEILSRLEKYDPATGSAELMDEYSSCLWRGTGTHKWLDTASGETFLASVHSVSPDGTLTLSLPDHSRRSFAFKEVAAII